MTEYEKKALRAAGKLANAAGLITGTGLNGWHQPCNVFEMHNYLVELQKRLDEYNMVILDWADHNTDEYCNYTRSST